MSLLHEIIAAFEQTDPAKAAQLRNELVASGGSPPEPAKPPTLLDELRTLGLDAVELAVSEVPSANEIPLVLGTVVKRIHQVEDALQAIQDKISTATPGPASPAAEPEAPAPAPRAAEQGAPEQPAESQGQAGAPEWPAPDNPNPLVGS